MNVKKVVMDAAVLKAVSEAIEMASRRRRRTAARKKAGLGAALGKTVEGLGMTAGKTVEGISAAAGKTVAGVTDTVGKTVEELGATAGKTAGALGAAVEKTVDATVTKTKDMTVGKVDEMRTQRRRAKLAKRRQKIRKQRMDRAGMWLGFGLVAALLYWWENRRDKSVREMSDQAARALRTAQETVTRTAQQVTSSDAFRSAKETVTRAAQEVGSRAGEVKTRFSADRGMDAEGNGHGTAAAGGIAATDERFTGRSEVTAPGELRGPSGPEVGTGMKVVGFDGVDIGRVQEVEPDGFILNRPKGSDLRVPKDAVARVEGTVVYLRVAANRVVQQGWESTGSD